MTKTINSSFIPNAVQLATEINHSAANSWLSDYRQQQISLLETCQFPHARFEHFKYNRLHGFDAHDFNEYNLQKPNHIIDGPFLESITIPGLDDNQSAIEQLVFINGVFSATKSQISGHGSHLVTQFKDATAQQQTKILSMLTEQNLTKNPFLVHNASLTGVNDNAILIEVNDNSSSAVLDIISIIDNEKPEQTMANQILIDIADSCSATIINRSVVSPSAKSNSTARQLISKRTIINVGENATCVHYELALQEENHLHFGSTCYNLHSHSELFSFNAAIGSLLNKIDIEVNHLGEHAFAKINGLYVASEDEQVDYHTTVNHPYPNGKTSENFRGIVNGHAEAVFNGRIHISEQAQKTLAELSNKNLLLSDNAILHTKPELEIYADDVICAHGATVSRLNDKSLSYLRARGINKAEAEMMLSYSFLDELLQELSQQAIADYIRPILFKRFE